MSNHHQELSRMQMQIRVQMQAALDLESTDIEGGSISIDIYYTLRNAVFSLFLASSLPGRNSFLEKIQSISNFQLDELVNNSSLRKCVIRLCAEALSIYPLESTSDLASLVSGSLGLSSVVYLGPFNFTAIGHYTYVLLAIHHLNIVRPHCSKQQLIHIECPAQYSASPLLIDLIDYTFEHVLRIDNQSIGNIPLSVMQRSVLSPNLWSETKYANAYMYQAGMLGTCRKAYREAVGLKLLGNLDDHFRGKEAAILIREHFFSYGLDTASHKIAAMHGRDDLFYKDLRSPHSRYYRNVDFKAYQGILEANNDILFVSLGINKWELKHPRLLHLCSFSDRYIRDLLQCFLLLSSDFAIGCSSGPSHLFSLMGIPTLFTNTIWDDIPLLAGPYGVTLFKSGLKDSRFFPNLGLFASSNLCPNYFGKFSNDFHVNNSKYFEDYDRYRYFFTTPDEAIMAFEYLRKVALNESNQSNWSTLNSLGIFFAQKYRLPVAPLIFDAYG